MDISRFQCGGHFDWAQYEHPPLAFLSVFNQVLRGQSPAERVDIDSRSGKLKLSRKVLIERPERQDA